MQVHVVRFYEKWFFTVEKMGPQFFFNFTISVPACLSKNIFLHHVDHSAML